jgi:hypothetical protein
MRSSTLVSAFLLISLLFAVAFANDSYWKPTEDDLKVVSYAELEISQGCKGSQYPQVREFLGDDYFDYPEVNFKAKWVEGEPFLKFYSKDGLIREINLGRFNRDDMIAILRHWGFTKNADTARSYRTQMYHATNGPRVEPAPELKLDENGNVILPDWFIKRETQILQGERDPYQRDYVLGEELEQELAEVEALAKFQLNVSAPEADPYASEKDEL